MKNHPTAERIRSIDCLAGPEREELLRHIAACDNCRAVLADEDPSRLFCLLSLEPIPVAALDRLSAAVADGIVPVRPAASRPYLTAASLAASLLLAAAFGAYFLNAPEPQEPWRAEVMELLDRNVPVRGIELLSSPGVAQVVDLEVGGNQVMMIFDKELDL